ncbi:putative heterogeneous nuclear ribonucleoprotein hrp1 [Lyophyllum shimeji]|uniref:Heterogeneous nuclear ribonucleoprotein hrp1 n=1 Tax=Lyophyllum shimeji TaxID=47721 RepID=A0A9P3UH52_LYOSH|nr:putative heterogeneous nuclear ribonucleoprotein hrp1 [Lyophyllum shimeji]
MSDLDADLYGDLYGNDDGEFHDPSATEEKDAQAPAAEAPAESRPAAPAVKEAAPAAKAAPATTTETNGQMPYSSVTTTTTTASTAPSYTQPVTQKIPTYEQPQPSRDVSPTGREGPYKSIPVNERTVRPSEMKDEGKMFIGGLNWDTTDETLRDYFSQFGKVDACTIMRDAAGRSRCFAFLTFEDPASVNAVMVREHFLDGKIIDPKRAIPRQEHQRATKLFIGGLAGSVTSESMREFFSQFGKVIDSTVMLDRETGRSKGFGFVSFEDTNVQPFLGFGNLEIDGKLIDVKLAQPRYQRDHYPNEDAVGGDFQSGAGRFGGQQAGFGGAGGMTAAAGAGNTPFDPQALAQLYTRMFQMAGGGQMNPAMMGGMGGGMNPMMGMGGGFAGGMRPGMGMGMGGGMAGMGVGGGMGGMGRGGMAGGAGMNPNIPRGPRGAGGGTTPTGPMGAGGPSVGPQRSQRGQHNFHPYAR